MVLTAGVRAPGAHRGHAHSRWDGGLHNSLHGSTQLSQCVYEQFPMRLGGTQGHSSSQGGLEPPEHGNSVLGRDRGTFRKFGKVALMRHK